VVTSMGFEPMTP